MEQPQLRLATSGRQQQTGASSRGPQAINASNQIGKSAREQSQLANNPRARPAQVSGGMSAAGQQHSADHPQATPTEQREVWTSTEDLFWDHMREVQNKWNTLKLNDDIWAKLIYFEQNRRLAKAYVSTPVLTIDGSTNGLDGFRIGLSGIENSYRNLDSIGCLRTIGHGIKLKIDQHGNILLRRIAPQLAAGASLAANQAVSSQCSVWIKEWPSAKAAAAAGKRRGPANEQHPSLSSAGSSSACSSSSGSSSSDYSHLIPLDQWPVQEICDLDTSYKLFDMQKFRRQLERRRASSSGPTSNATLLDWRQCVSIISFVRQPPPPPANARLANATATAATARGQAGLKVAVARQQTPLLSDPCWIMLINIIAIDMLKSSICDNANNYAQPPGPSSQISSMIDRYQQRARQSRLATRARLPAPTGQAIDENSMADDCCRRPNGPSNKPGGQLRQVALSPSKRSELQQRCTGTNFVCSEQQSSGNERELQQTLTSASSSERLSRQFDHFNQLASRPSEPLKVGARPQQQQQQHQRQGFMANGGSWSSSSNNAIYTTFTGKYLDKQQRQRRSARPPQPPGERSLEDLTFASTTQPQSPAPAGQRAHSRPLYRVAPMNGNAGRFAQLQQANRQRALSPLFMAERGSKLADQYEANAAVGRLPFARAKPTSELRRQQQQQQHMVHSLSAFDISHGHKLNLRSLKSIKMNFDEGSGSEHELHTIGRAGKENNPTNDYSAPRARRSRMALQAFNREASEWATLAQRYSRLAGCGGSGGGGGATGINSKQTKSTNELGTQCDTKTRHQDEALQNSSSTISSSQLFADELLEDEEALPEQEASKTSEASPIVGQSERAKKGGQIKKVSRGSLASSASYSSGCADNDYFISQSSSSSMSSSAHSDATNSNDRPRAEHDQADVASPTASSSGIVGSGVGETSHLNGIEPKLSGAENNSRLASGERSDKSTSGKRGAIKDLPPEVATAAAPCCGPQLVMMTKRQLKASISHNRRHNTKRMVHDQAAGCEHQCCSHESPQQEHNEHEQQQCDCMLEQDRHQFGGPNNACDCCCDCFNQGPLVEDRRAVDLCDCCELSGAPQVELQEEGPEEPIYDQLPRFGQSAPTTTQTQTNKSIARKLAAGRASRNGSCADLTGNNDIAAIPMPDEPAGKGTGAKELKRTSGWLERRKYIRLLPKFMFSSASSASSSSSPSPLSKPLHPGKGAATKSGTLDRNGESLANKFRRTRSSQNLSH